MSTYSCFSIHFYIHVSCYDQLCAWFNLLDFVYSQHQFLQDALLVIRLGIHIDNFQVWLDVCYVHELGGKDLIFGNDELLLRDRCQP